MPRSFQVLANGLSAAVRPATHLQRPPSFLLQLCFAPVPPAIRAAPPSTPAVIGNPHLSFAILPNQNLERKVDGTAGRGEHERCSCLGAAKNNQLRRTHLEPCLFRF